VTRSHMKGEVSVDLSSYKLKLKLCKAYGETKPHEPLALIGSHGFLEIALNQGSAAAEFKTEPGDAVTLSLA